jgi:hypothetical protein
VIYGSAVQQYQFNMPYQFGHPKHLPDTSEVEDAALMEVTQCSAGTAVCSLSVA